ncbi:hypothetical protein PTKIN_Ptkin01aG0114800 [Pterospermum kingtungense]
MVVHDEHEAFVSARTCWFSGFSSAQELDAKVMVDVVHGECSDIMGFSAVIRQCQSILMQNSSYSVGFAKRRANRVAYALARIAHSYASPTVMLVPPLCIASFLYE